MTRTVALTHASAMNLGASGPLYRKMLRSGGVALVALGVLLSPYAEWRMSDVFITISDVLFASGAILLLIGGGIQFRPFGAATFYWMASFALMIFGLFVGSLVNGDPIRWLIAAVQYGFSLVLLPFILMSNDENVLMKYMMHLVFGVFVMEVFSSIMYYTYSDNYYDYHWIANNFVTGGWRLGAFLGQANWNGAVIAMVLPFVIYMALKRLVRVEIAVLVGAAFALGLLLSASFTGFVSALIVLLVFFLMSGLKNALRGVVMATVALGILLASGFQLPSAFQARVAGALETGDMDQAGTYTDRMDLIREAWSMVDDRMIVGLGVDQYRVVSQYHTPVHNMYLLLWVEGGLLALTGWLFLMTIFAVSVVRVYRYDPQICALGTSVFTVFMIFTMASPHMYARVWLVPLVLAGGVVFGRLSREIRQVSV